MFDIFTDLLTMRYFIGFETLVAELSRCVSAVEHLIEEGQSFLEVLLDPSSRGPPQSNSHHCSPDNSVVGRCITDWSFV